jgi:putative flippase GtrA
VGVLVTGLDFLMLAFQVEICNIYYLLAACISYSIASGVHYVLSAKYVFKTSQAEKSFKTFLYFAFLGAIGLALFEGLMYYFVEDLKIYYLLAKVFATGIIFSFNFATRKFLLFK